MTNIISNPTILPSLEEMDYGTPFEIVMEGDDLDWNEDRKTTHRNQLLNLNYSWILIIVECHTSLAPKMVIRSISF